MSSRQIKLVFADGGAFHALTINVPADVLARYPRLLDALREDPAISAMMYVDFRRLVAAHIMDEEAGSGDSA